MIRRFLDRMSKINQAYDITMSRLAKVETFGAMVVMVCLLAGLWASAWYGHIIFPWLDGWMA